jgi:two-component system response regulator DevR
MTRSGPKPATSGTYVAGVTRSGPKPATSGTYVAGVTRSGPKPATSGTYGPRWFGPSGGRKGGMIRVFLLDDHEVVRRGLVDLLQAAGDIEVVGESGLAQEAARRIPAMRPDVAILDARLPDGNGIDVCRDVRAVDSTIKGLILTSYEDDEALFAAIMAGASGYVLKQIRGTDLVDAVRRVAAGQSLLDPAVTQRVLERIRHGVEQPRELASLTDQERRILEFIAEGLTNREIAGRMFLAEKTVKNYVSSLLAKLGLERRTQAAVLATRLLGDPSGQDFRP